LSVKELKSQLNYSKTATPVTGVITGNNDQIETKKHISILCRKPPVMKKAKLPGKQSGVERFSVVMEQSIAKA